MSPFSRKSEFNLITKSLVADVLELKRTDRFAYKRAGTGWETDVKHIPLNARVDVPFIYAYRHYNLVKRCRSGSVSKHFPVFLFRSNEALNVTLSWRDDLALINGKMDDDGGLGNVSLFEQPPKISLLEQPQKVFSNPRSLRRRISYEEMIHSEDDEEQLQKCMSSTTSTSSPFRQSLLWVTQWILALREVREEHLTQVDIRTKYESFKFYFVV